MKRAMAGKEINVMDGWDERRKDRRRKRNRIYA